MDEPNLIPPGHGEEPSEGSLALCAHPAENLYERQGHVWCRRCGRALHPTVREEDTVKFQKGDRVVVTDLRHGTQHPGVVTKPPAEPSDITTQHMNVRYDTGEEVRVGSGFVRAES